MSKSVRALVVEDSETQALRLEHILQEAGMDTEVAGTAAAAVDALGRQSVDIILLDYHLPDSTGEQFCRKLRENLGTRTVPVLLLTADTTGGLEQRVLESGADDYLPKSESDDILLLRVEALIRKRQSHMGMHSIGRMSTLRSRVLLVTHSQDRRDYLLAQFGQEEYEFVAKSSGATALDAAIREQFDAIVFDLPLPDMEGAEFCTKLTERTQSKDVPYVILALTNQENKDDVTQLIQAGADDALAQSVHIEIIKARLQAALRRNYIYADSQNLARDFHERESELRRAREARAAAEARAAMADELANANHKLEAAYRELQETQVQLIQAAKMVSLGELVAGVAHEINNPLAFVMSHLDTVRDALQRFSGEGLSVLSGSGRRKYDKALKRTGDMQIGLERIRDLVLKLRTFSRLDEGELKVVDLHENIESVLALLEYRIGDGVEITRQFGNVPRMACYPGPLNQAIMNVLTNALDAIAEGGTISITTRHDQGKVSIEIADNGPGIPEDVKAKIFNPFFTTKPVGVGTGLGLSIAYKVMERHGGSINAANGADRGTTMTLTIPDSIPADGTMHAVGGVHD